MNMKKKFVILGALLVFAAVFAAFRTGHGRNGDAGYTSVKVERGNLKITVATTGTVKPQNRVEIKPPVAGRIEEVLFDEGAVVHKGEIIGYLSSTDLAALLDAARAKGKDELERWEKLYNPMPIVAPIDGSIIARSVEPGQTVAASEEMLVMSDRLIVQAQVDETDIGRVKRGQQTEFTLDAYPAEIITGVVDQIAYEATTVNNVTMYYVDVLPDHVPSFMRSGMTANILIVTAVTNNVLVLPTGAVQVEKNDSTVWLSDQENSGRPVRVKISAGMNDGKKVEIISGLKEGDAVLTASEHMPETKQSKVNPFMPFGRKK